MRFVDACDLGRPGGGPLGPNLIPGGVLRAESKTGEGARLDRTSIVDLIGGEVLRSIADVEFVSMFGGLAFRRALVMLGEAVCALDGGGGAGLAGTSSVPAYAPQLGN